MTSDYHNQQLLSQPEKLTSIHKIGFLRPLSVRTVYLLFWDVYNFKGTSASCASINPHFLLSHSRIFHIISHQHYMSRSKDAFQDPLTINVYQLSHLDVFSTFFEAPNSANDTSQVLWGISEFYVTIKFYVRIKLVEGISDDRLWRGRTGAGESVVSVELGGWTHEKRHGLHLPTLAWLLFQIYVG